MIDQTKGIIRCLIRQVARIVSCVILMQGFANGQDNRGVIPTDSIPLLQWLHQAEIRSGYHFFFDSAVLKTTRVIPLAYREPLKVLLDSQLLHTGLHAAIDAEKNAIIVPSGFPLTTRFAPSFFQSKPSPVPATEENHPEEISPASPVTSIEHGDENKIYRIGESGAGAGSGSHTLAGYIRDEKNGEAIAGASINADSSSTLITSDQFGYYSISLRSGRHTVYVSAVGMQPTRRLILIQGDGKLNIEMNVQVPSLKTVVVVAERNSNTRRLQMGLERLNIQTIRSIPVLLGEADVMRVLQTLPGVSTVGEASAGFNVRGGSADQNLVLFNGATVYNPAHLFGFFSAFNPDVIKGVELYKSSIPAKYGGRLSSVLDVSTRDGNSKKWSGNAGIGFLTSKITVEGPLKKDKSSMIIGARTTYSNWLLRSIRNSSYSNSTASFYDIDWHLTQILDARNSLYLTAYASNDRFRLSSDTAYQYGNRNAVVTWKHNFNNRLYASLTAGLDDYQYSVTGDQGNLQGFELKFGIRQYHAGIDFSLKPNNHHAIDFGIQSLRYQLQPGTLYPRGGQTLVIKDRVQKEQALESALYASDKITLSPSLSLDAGLRYSLFNYLGPKEVYEYAEGLPLATSTLRDTISYGPGKFIKTYQGPEIRLALRYSISENSSFKFSYNTLRQYIHLIYNTTAISPTDIWKLSDPHIRPQLGQQISAGYYQDFPQKSIETSIEVYYKKIRNYLDYKSGANLVLNHHIETDLIETRGYAYGLELLVKKTAGKWNGWVSYTYSRSFLRQDDSLAGQLINKGEYYPANFDKPHNLNIIATYRFSHRYSVTLSSAYSTGRPITLPIAIFDLAGSQRIYYSERNQFRIPNYFRMDFSVNIEGNHRIRQATHNSWSLGVYNLTARKNPYSVYFVEEGGIIKGYKLSVIGTAIPYITYNIRF